METALQSYVTEAGVVTRHDPTLVSVKLVGKASIVASAFKGNEWRCDPHRPDWLAVAYEAALMLRDRQTTTPDNPLDLPRCLRNIEYGTKVVAELEAKYPHLTANVQP